MQGPPEAASLPDERVAPTPSREESIKESLPVLAALVPAVVALVVVAVIGRDLWFFSDDWNILADYHSGGLLEPFNGHLSLVPAGIYQLLFRSAGTGSYVPFRLVGLLALAVVGFQVARLAAQPGDGAGRANPRVRAVVGVLAVAAVLWNSAGTMVLMFPFLMNFTIPVAALAAIWWHLDRRTARGEAAASVWLAVALATSGLGVVTLGAVVVELLVGRAPLRRWLVLSPGPLLWGIWFLTHRDANELTTDPVAVASYVGRMLLAGMTSIAGGWTPGGALLSVVFVAYLAVAVTRWGRPEARLAGALAAPVVFALSTAVTRIGIVPEIPPDESRYSWAVAAFFVMAALVAPRPGPSRPPAVPRGVGAGAAVLAGALLLVGAVGLVGDLREWNDRVRTARPGLSALLFSMEAIGEERIDPDRVVPLSYVPVTTGGYLGAIAAVGSPIDGEEPTSFLAGDPYALATADQLLVEELPIGATPAGGCPTGTRPQPAATGTIEIHPGTSVVLSSEGGTSTEPVISRFGAPGDLTVTVPPTGATLTLPDDAPGVDGSALQYRLTLPEGVEAATCAA